MQTGQGKQGRAPGEAQVNPQAAQSFPPPQSVLFGLPRGETDSLQARAGPQGRAAHRRSQLRSVRGNRYVGLLNVTERLRVGTALSPQQEVTCPWPGDLPNPGLAARSQAP